MTALDDTKPYIVIERGRDTNALRMVPSRKDSTKGVHVVLPRTTENSDALDYFYEKLKDGMNL